MAMIKWLIGRRALSHRAAPGRLPPVISGHNNDDVWGPGQCSTGQVLIGVGFALADIRHTYAHVMLAATHRYRPCVSFEQDVPIVVGSHLRLPHPLRLWPAIKS